MSTTNNMRSRAIRHRLLVTVSAAALLASAYGVGEAHAADNDSDRPPLWIELGGQFEQLDGQGDPFAPTFVANTDWSGIGLISPAEQQKMHIFSLGEEASISFQPSDTEWVFSGSIRYGRSGGHKVAHQQSKGLATSSKPYKKYIHATPRYAQTKADNTEAHVIADFQAGKDVGLGLFGNESTSVFNVGVRFAQFSAKSDATIRARPDVHFGYVTYGLHLLRTQFHEYFGSAQRAASFNGVGPSISWKASAPFAGNPDTTELAFDWGVNAAILFGRQKTRIHHHSTGSYHYKISAPIPSVSAQLPPHTATGDRSHSMAVPNLGGFAGLSFRYSGAKISFGYRGDFFFGAIDGGIDTRKSEDRNFYGPFASISVGIGD